jgi:hypothetical protein
MMPAIKKILAAAAFLIGAIPAAHAQYPYVAPPPPVVYSYPFLPSITVYPYVPTTPLEWSYDPYTSGLGPCPQRFPGDPPCKETMHPSYGQPSYWPR